MEPLVFIVSVHQPRTEEQYISLSTRGRCGARRVCVCAGADADPAERPALPGDWHHRQGDGEEVRQIPEEDDLAVLTEGPREKVRALTHVFFQFINKANEVIFKSLKAQLEYHVGSLRE